MTIATRAHNMGCVHLDEAVPALRSRVELMDGPERPFRTSLPPPNTLRLQLWDERPTKEDRSEVLGLRNNGGADSVLGQLRTGVLGGHRLSRDG